MGMRFIRSLKNGSKIPKIYEYSTNNSKSVAVNIAHPMYPGGFPTSTGEYVMVSVNYYSLPWPLGSIHYGEQDTINILYVGSDAQTWYNKEYNTIGTIKSYTGFATFSFGAITWIVGKLGLDAVLSTVLGGAISTVGVIIAGTAFAISKIQSYMGGRLHDMYDSTYANPLYGEPKFLWMFYSDVYIYVGVGSSFTWNGYTNSGTVSMLPYIPVVSNNPAFIVVAGSLSGTAHDISGKIGWNSWGTES